MTTPTRVMLLIDADNVSTDVIEQAISRLHAEYGALHVRRAYGTAEAAVKHQRLFKRLSIRPMVNLAAGKNSTDIAMAVDAIDLVISERPDVVVIASSDSDFAPLVSRIREKGCLVRGVGQKGKVGEETPLIYDDFIEFEHRASRSRGPASESAAESGSAQRRTRTRTRPRSRGAAAAEAAEAAPAPVTGRARKTAPRKRAQSEAAEAAPEVTPEVTPEAAAAPATTSPKTAARKTSARRKPAPAAARSSAGVAKAAVADEAVAPAAIEATAAAAAMPEAPAALAPARKRAARSRRAAAPGDGSAASAEAAPAAPAVPAAPDEPIAPARKAPRKTAARKSAAAPAAARADVAPPAAPPPPAMPEKVARALAVLPPLAAGQRMDVQNAAAVLRKERVFSNADSWPKFFERYKDWFELTPAGRPTHVQRRAPA